MAESLLFGRVDQILGRVASLAAEQVLLAWGLKDDLNKLTTTLSGIKAVVLDAENQPASNHRITFWLKQLKDVLYYAEDVLDDVAYEALSKQVRDTTSSALTIEGKVRRFFSSSNPIAFRIRMGRKVKEIRLRLDKIAALKAQFNLAEQLDRGSVCLRERELTHSFVNASDIVGIEGDKDAIVKFLMDSFEGHNVSVLPIVGIGGLGKTVVVKMVFNDQKIVHHFDTFCWVCLGDMKEFDVHKLMAKIVKDQSDPEQLQSATRNNFGNKKFLLILDDVWDVNRDKWLELLSLLACGAQGSKIVVTTGHSSVASCVSTTLTYKLKGLRQEECVSLFKRLAFRSEDEVDENLMKIGDEIVRKCKGVPLAVRSLASMLFSEPDQSEWLLVRDSDIWQMKENQNGIVPILRFSYDRLPPHLKQCFVYCSLFPEDYEFKDFSLISFWMAHGLLQSPQRNQKLERVGKQYIKELLSRGFFQDVVIADEYTWRIKMHDLVQELACLLGKDEFAMMNAEQKSVPNNIRHVYFVKEQEFLANSDNAIRTVILNDVIRTFVFTPGDKKVKVCESNKFVEACISKFEHLRVLWLADSNLTRLPNSIDIVKHLRSLDLSYCKKLRRLPDSFCKLHHLEYLSLLLCSELEEVPENMGQLVNLRWLWITTKQKYFSKNGIGCLTSLQFLWLEKCENLEFLFEGERLQLASLQTLVVWNCGNLKSMFPPVPTTGSSDLHYFLPALEVIDVTECGNLMDGDCTMEEENVHQLGDKTKVSYPVRTLNLHVPRLKTLKMTKILKLKRLPEWIRGSTHTLQYLSIVSCENLEALPEWLVYLSSLQKLHLCNCKKVLLLPEGMRRLTALKELHIINSNYSMWKHYYWGGVAVEIARVPNFIMD